MRTVGRLAPRARSARFKVFDPNPDRVGHPQVGELASAAEGVHRRGAYPQPVRHLAHRKQSP